MKFQKEKVFVFLDIVALSSTISNDDGKGTSPTSKHQTE